MHKPKVFLLFIAVALLNAGCGLNLSNRDTATPTVYIITATLPPSLTPPPPATPLPPTLVPTLPPVEGRTTTQVNVRGEPSTASAVLGMIGPFAKVQITGKDPSGNWYQIVYEQGPEGKGWVTAAYVQVTGKPEIPAIGGGGSSSSSEAGLGSGPSGVVVQKINVRSGPGTGFNGIGTLNPQDVVILTGKDANGAWLQIGFAAGPDGKGWVTAAYVQASGVENLPIVTESGQVVGTGTPTGIPPTPTPTLVAAPSDGDSAQSPAVSATFSPFGARALIYSSDVSAPEGDAEDWVQFIPYGQNVSISLTCTGNSALTVELWQNGQPLSGWGSLSCGDKSKLLAVTPAQSYLFRLQATPSSNELKYTHFTVTIETAQ